MTDTDNIDMLTKEQIAECDKRGIPLPVGSAAYGRRIAEAEITALRDRVNEAKAKGEPLTLNDAFALERALKEGWIQQDVQESARDMMAKGLRQSEIDRQGGVAAKLGELTALTREIEAAYKVPGQDDFPAKVEAVRKAKELRAKYDAGAEGIRVLIGHLTDDEYKQLAHGHVNELEKRLEVKFHNEG